MENSFKQKVSEALNKWLEESPENRTLNGLAEEHGITKLYVSRIKNGVFKIEHKDNKVTEIADEYFYRIAEAIGLMHRSGSGLHWETGNFKRIKSACKQAQGKRLRILLEAPTGHGKTYTLDYYQIHQDKVVYIKATRSMTERNLLQAILRKLGIHDAVRGNREMLNQIRFKLTGTPGYLFILDEAEYLRPALFHVVKEIADFTEGKCGFVLAGYGVIQIINKLANKGRIGFPQLRRRFFPNRLILPERIENSEIVNICHDAGITDDKVHNVIKNYVRDFDMLSQVVVDITNWQKANSRKMSAQEVLDRFKDSFES